MNKKSSRSAFDELSGAISRELDLLCSQSRHRALAVACSGGLDSMALLHLASEYARTNKLHLHVFHVHHGLSSNADAWLTHCEHAAQRLNAGFDARRVNLRLLGTGIESAARTLRYKALGDMCRAHHVDVLLTAHHLSDQAETVLLNLLRGAGTAGLSAMATSGKSPKLLGSADVVLVRPLLSVKRSTLEMYVGENALTWVEDESNSDTKFARNALRHQVMPALDKAFPGFQHRFARSAAHAQSAQRLLVEVAAEDLVRLDASDTHGHALDIEKLRLLSVDRISNLLRHWLEVNQASAPSTSWLAQLIQQVLGVSSDTRMLVTHPDCTLHSHRGRLYLAKRSAHPTQAVPIGRDDDSFSPPEQTFVWSGESRIEFAAYGGVFCFDGAETGIDATWLQRQLLRIGPRRGGERIKLSASRPTRSLKAHYQSIGIPPWIRPNLPVLWAGDSLLFAAGVGTDIHHNAYHSGDAIALRWEPPKSTESATQAP